MSSENEITRGFNQLTLRASESELMIPIQGLEKLLREVHLGQLPLGPGGWSRGFKDRDEAEIVGTGVKFIVSQASYGATAIAVAAKEGYTVEALAFDKESKQPKWRSPYNAQEEVDVSWDHGNLQKMSVGSPTWGDANLLGNPGIRAGMVRITEIATGDVRYFGLGAKFSGRADNWWVERGVIEFTKVENLPETPLPLS